MSDPVREIAEMVTRIESGPCMIEGALLRNAYAMLGLHGKAATIEVGIRMVDEGTLRELAQLLGQAGLVEALEEPGPRLVDGRYLKGLLGAAFKPLFTSYDKSAVHFDGATYLRNDGLLNAPDSPFYGFSFWLKFTGPTTGSNVTFAHDPSNTLRPAGAFTQSNPGEFFSLWRSTDTLSSFELHSTVTLTQGVWHHVMGAVDLNHPLNQKVGKVYVDGVLATQAPIDFGAPFVNAVVGKMLTIGGTPGGDKQIADLFDVRLAPGQNWLVNGVIPPSTIALFRDSNGKPVDPSVATAVLGRPAVMLTGNAAGFVTNQGYGGPFTVVGTLTNPTDSPTGAKPTNVDVPAVLGTATIGSTLTCTTGNWNGTPTSYSYQWKSAAVNVGTNSAAYVVAPSDAGNVITCVVTATNALGSTAAPPTTGVSIPSTPVAPPAITTAPAITGPTTAGSFLTCSTGVWANFATGYTYQWQTAGVPNGTTSADYLIKATDTGKQLRCLVTAYNNVGASSPAASNVVTAT